MTSTTVETCFKDNNDPIPERFPIPPPRLQCLCNRSWKTWKWNHLGLCHCSTRQWQQLLLRKVLRVHNLCFALRWNESSFLWMASVTAVKKTTDKYKHNITVQTTHRALTEWVFRACGRVRLWKRPPGRQKVCDSEGVTHFPSGGKAARFSLSDPSQGSKVTSLLV